VESRDNAGVITQIQLASNLQVPIAGGRVSEKRDTEYASSRSLQKDSKTCLLVGQG
jgi:hypothetical protein